MVLGLMWIMSPVAWPTAKLLDYLLGEDHGTTYKKAGLKSLVTLHKSLGHVDERLNEDEVTIISAVLDLKAKPVGNIMTPMKDVFTMPSDAILDEKMMEIILSAGYSRIPIHTPENKNDFVGMLLVKMLITYDPEDALRVREFALATLPETRPETSCLDIINFFQEGKSHMVLVSDFPGDSHGAVGVVTLEDVIEELIGEWVSTINSLYNLLTIDREIIDESDVFVDVHKAIRRMAPAPRTRAPKGAVVLDSRKPSEAQVVDGETDTEQNGGPRKMSMPEQSEALRPVTFMLRRRSTGNKGTSDPLRADDPELMKHLKHLGPSNAANRPKSTRINTVKIKPGNTASPQPEIPTTIPEYSRPPSQGVLAQQSHAPEGGIGEGLLSSAAGEASDGVHSLAVGYGTMAAPGTSWSTEQTGAKNAGDDAVSPGARSDQPTFAEVAAKNTDSKNENRLQERHNSHSTIGSLHSGKSRSRSPPKKRHTARSGSISENIIDVNGVRKIVLETTSSSDSEDKLVNSQTDGAQDSRQQSEDESPHPSSKGEGKKKRKKRGKKKNKGGNSSESQPLLGSR
jgi:metal transporter CNNM